MSFLSFHDGTVNVSDAALAGLNAWVNYFTLSPRSLQSAKADTPIEIGGYVRDDLPKFFNEAGLLVGAEVGVEQGLFSEKLLRLNPGGKLFSIDAWEAYSGYREHVTQSKLDGFFEATCRRLEVAANESGGESIVVRGRSTMVATTFADRSLDYVYLDANHTLPQIIADLDAWAPKVRIGGVIAGHDYIRGKQSGYQVHVVDALQAWTRSYAIRPWFVLGSKEKVEGVPRDRARSWAYVRLT